MFYTNGATISNILHNMKPQHPHVCFSKKDVKHSVAEKNGKLINGLTEKAHIQATNTTKEWKERKKR